MIVRNEEATLGHCLESVRGLVDEIVIVNTGSQDRTLEIAESFGAILGHFPWGDDFAEARNHSLSLCTGDWVLVLDADEAIDSQDHGGIREALHQEKTPAFRMTLRNYLPSGDLSTVGVPATQNRSSYQEGKDFGYYADSQGLRLCRRLPGLSFRGRIHELLDPYFEARNLSIGVLPSVIHHFGKLHLERESHKACYYLQLTETEARMEPGNFQIQFNLLQQALVAQAWPIAHDAASRCLRLRENVPSLVLLGEAAALLELGHPREARPFVDRVLEVEPSNAPALLLKASSFAQSGELPKARELFNQAIHAQPEYLLPYLSLAELEKRAGDRAAARQALCSGLSQAPKDLSLLDSLVKLSVEGRDLAQVLEDCLMALSRRPDGGSGLWHRPAPLGHAKNGAGATAFKLPGYRPRPVPWGGGVARLRRSLS